MSDLTISDLPNFFHKPPEGYYYEIRDYKRNVVSIWLCCNTQFDYNMGKPTSTIWGFFSQKTGKYHSPVNSKEVGAEVDILNTRNWSAMPIFKSALEKFFV